MNMPIRSLAMAGMAGVLAISSSSCYSYYQPGAYGPVQAQQDAKDGYVPEEAPTPPARGYYAGPRYVVDPGMVVAGVAAAGLLGYALGNHHHSHGYYGPQFYGGGYYRGGYYR